MIYVTQDQNGSEHVIMWVGEKPTVKNGCWNRMTANGFHWDIGKTETAKALGIEIEPGECREYELVERKGTPQ